MDWYASLFLATTSPEDRLVVMLLLCAAVILAHMKSVSVTSDGFFKHFVTSVASMSVARVFEKSSGTPGFSGALNHHVCSHI